MFVISVSKLNIVGIAKITIRIPVKWNLKHIDKLFRIIFEKKDPVTFLRFSFKSFKTVVFQMGGNAVWIHSKRLSGAAESVGDTRKIVKKFTDYCKQTRRTDSIMSIISRKLVARNTTENFMLLPYSSLITCSCCQFICANWAVLQPSVNKDSSER